jgi:hypothetical protein
VLWDNAIAEAAPEVLSVRLGTAVTAVGVATVTARIGTGANQPWSVGANLAGLQYVAGQIPLDGAPPSVAFFTLTADSTPGGGANPAGAFKSYGTLTTTTAVASFADVAAKLTATGIRGWFACARMPAISRRACTTF